MNSLLERISKNKGKPQQQFLALVIGGDSVHSAVWQAEPAPAHIVNVGSVEEWVEEADKLITAADASLATALENISPEPDQVILGLPETWVEDDKIASTRQDLIQALTTQLTLKPIGFVITAEAIINFLKNKEGVPPTCILLELTETEATVSIIKVGKSSGSHTVGRSEDLGADVEEGLARFNTSDPLPARIILYNGHLDLEAARQTLLSYSWQDKLPFLHFPKVEILEGEVPLRAVVMAAGNELTITIPAEKQADVTESGLEAHGFYVDQDVLKDTAAAQPQPPGLKETREGMMRQPAPQAPFKPPQPQPETPTRNTQTHEEVMPRATGVNFRPLLDFRRTIKYLGGNLLQGGKKIPGVLLVWVVALLLILGGVVVAYWTVPKAEVTIFLTSRILEENLSFRVASGRSTDLEAELVAGQKVEAEVEGELKRDTTGESVSGDKAKGEATVFNKTGSVKKFAAGTQLVGPQGIEFELDEEITIASQSATDTGITFGKATAKATAVKVGSEANIIKDTTLTVKGFDASSYSAKAEADFTGGSSKQVKVVTQEDRDQLLEELTQKLEAEAVEKMKQAVASDETLIDTGFATEEMNKKFSKAVDEEAGSVSLTLRLKTTSLKFKTEEAFKLTQEKMKQEVPQGFMTTEVPQVEIDDAKVDGGEAEVEAKVKTALVPQLDPSEVATNLAGKYPEVTESYLKSLPNFSRVEISLSPKLPPKLATFPRRSQNITVKIEAE